MGTAVARIGAVILGVILLGLALLPTFGAAALVPAGMLVGAYWARRRGRRLTALQGWVIGVLTFGFAVTVGLAWAGVAGPLRGRLAQAEGDIDKAVAQAQKTPPRQSAFLRRLNAPPPAPLPASVAKPLVVVSAVLAIEFWCLFIGTVSWGGTALIVFGVRGPRPPPDPVSSSFDSLP